MNAQKGMYPSCNLLPGELLVFLWKKALTDLSFLAFFVIGLVARFFDLEGFFEGYHAFTLHALILDKIKQQPECQYTAYMVAYCHTKKGGRGGEVACV